jgi:hypothetical protein
MQPRAALSTSVLVSAAALLAAALTAGCRTATAADSEASPQPVDAAAPPVDAARDCSEAFGGVSTPCVVIACPERYREFIGTWTGPFESFDRELNAFRPFTNEVRYAESDCLQTETGDQLIIGRRTDTYPAFQGLVEKTETGLLITGVHADGSPFLRTVGSEGASDYQLVYKSDVASMSIWRLTVATDDGDMIFTTIDGKDFEAPAGTHTRKVTVSLEMPAIGYAGVVSKGHHTHAAAAARSSGKLGD